MKKLLKKLIPDWMLSIYHWKLALLGALVYSFPSRKLKVIGVTGTKGKSTVVMLAGKVLAELGDNSPQPPLNLRGGENTNPPQPSFSKGGKTGLPKSDFKGSPKSDFGSPKVGWISSLTINDGKKEVMNPYHMTMPGRFFIQKTLAQMVKNGCEYALVEVTSEGIKQHRHRFIDWLGVVFTNLAAEHLEAHGGFENYRKAKMKLFAAVAKNKESFGVYNLDDENVEWFLRYPVSKKYGYGVSLRGVPPWRDDAAIPRTAVAVRDCFATLAMTDVKLNANGSEFKINGVKFKTNLLGEFNVYNCAAAAAVGQACGVTLEETARALGRVQSIPGRLEIINEGQDFTVVVDLAHTPDSFEKVFRLFKELKNKSHSPFFQEASRPTPAISPSPQTCPASCERRGEEGQGGALNITSPDPSSTEEGRKTSRIISVFGSAGGGRDKWKRPELGKIASQHSDQVFITNEDTYDEDPLAIATEILTGCDKAKADIILDRRQAIAKALSLAQKDDIVLILGKGTEQTMFLGDKKINWDDRNVVREEIKKIKADL
ncbi:hypothetical protein KKF25_01765 [Patescibacteria group bacterium]|nr:hypothetical protein [Patescibacteria group bacterium]